MKRAQNALFIFCLAAGCGGGTNNNGGASDMAVPPDMTGGGAHDMAKLGPDMSFVNTGTDPAGAPCKDASGCGGTHPTCLMSLTGFQQPIPAAGGYCTDKPCKSDADCGDTGFCVAQLGYCLGSCSKAGECQKVNPNNNCFMVDPQNMVAACLPIKGECDPTSLASCMGTGACQRTGGAIDNVGSCIPTCKFGEMCPAGKMGEMQSCYFLTNRIDVKGNPTGDAFAGLVCIYDASSMGGGAPDSMCMYLNSCQAGYECDFWGGKLCKKLCRNGMNDCTNGTCTNAYKLAQFNMGDIGLCL